MVMNDATRLLRVYLVVNHVNYFVHNDVNGGPGIPALQYSAILYNRFIRCYPSPGLRKGTPDFDAANWSVDP
jgi:hypothetical protein